MSSYNSLEQEDDAKEPTRSDTARAETFADAVLAIVITLLVLDLKAPDVPPGCLAHGLLAQWPRYSAYITTYLFIAVQWMNHKATFMRVRQMDRGLHWCHFALLGSTALLPFPTQLIAVALQNKDRYDQQIATAVYAGVGALLCLTWTYFFHYLGNHPELAAESVEDWFFHAERVRTVAGVALYACAGLLGWFVHPAAALAVFFVLPVFYGVTSHGIAESPHLLKAVLVQ